MPGVVMTSGGITGCGLTPLLGMLSIDSVVNTDLNCSFKMSAFCLVSEDYQPWHCCCHIHRHIQLPLDAVVKTQTNAFGL
jgi:hypothetical protein